MGDLVNYIYKAPLCNGLDGKGCSDYLARKEYPEYKKPSFPNNYCAILVDYSTKRLYYDSLCESCRFRNEVEIVVEQIRKNGVFYFNPKEAISFVSKNTKPKINKFSMFATKKYCDNYIRFNTKLREKNKKEITESNYIFDKNFSSSEIETLMDPEKLEERKKRFKRKREDITPKVNPQSREEIEMNIAYMEQMLAQMRENK